MSLTFSQRRAARVWIVVLSASLLCPSVRAADAPKAGPTSAAVSAAESTVKTAVETLKKEFEAKPQQLRTKCNVITTESDDATVDAILKMLDTGSSAPQSIYIKWQLLSGLPSHVKDKQASRLAAIYMRAPDFTPHPSLDPRTRRQLDSWVPGHVKDDEVDKAAEKIEKMNTDWAEKVKAAMAPDIPIAIYRNELFSRLPATADTIKAGIKDAFDRASAGIDDVKGSPGITGADMMAMADGLCHNWAASGAQPAELADMKALLEKIDTMMGGPSKDGPILKHKAQGPNGGFDHTATALGLYRNGASVLTIASAPAVAPGTFPPKIYTNITGPEKGVCAWASKPAPFIVINKLEELIVYLGDCIKNPGGGLKFKEPT